MQITKNKLPEYALRFSNDQFVAVKPVSNFSICGGRSFSWSICFCAGDLTGKISLIEQEGAFTLGMEDGRLFYSAKGLGELVVDSTCEFKTHHWYTIVVTYDQSELLFYVNGEQIAAKTLSAASKVSIADYQIGKSFQGHIAYVRLYNRTLSKEETEIEYTTEELKKPEMELAMEFTSMTVIENGNNNLEYKIKKFDSKTALVIHEGANFEIPTRPAFPFSIVLQVYAARPVYSDRATIFSNWLDGENKIEIYLTYSQETDCVFFSACLGNQLIEQKNTDIPGISVGESVKISFLTYKISIMKYTSMFIDDTLIKTITEVLSTDQPLQYYLGNDKTGLTTFSGGIQSVTIDNLNGLPIRREPQAQYTFDTGKAVETLSETILQLPGHVGLEPSTCVLGCYEGPEKLFEVSLQKLSFCHCFSSPQEDPALSSIPLYSKTSLEWTPENSFDNPSHACYTAATGLQPYITAELACTVKDGVERQITLSGSSKTGCCILGDVECQCTVSKTETQTQKLVLTNHSIAGSAGGGYLNPLDWSVKLQQEKKQLGTTYHAIHILPQTPLAPWSLTEAAHYPSVDSIKLFSEAMRLYAYDIGKLPQPQSVETMGTYFVYWLHNAEIFSYDAGVSASYAKITDGSLLFDWEPFAANVYRAIENKMTGNAQKVSISSLDAAVFVALMTRLAGFQMNVLRMEYGPANRLHYAATSANSVQDPMNVRVFDGVLKNERGVFSANLLFSTDNDSTVHNKTESYYREMLFHPGERCSITDILI